MSSIIISRSSLSQLLRKFSSCMALYAQVKSLSSLGNAPLSSNILFLAMSHELFRHETYNCKVFPEPFALLPCGSSLLSFNFSSFSIPVQNLSSSSLRIICSICPCFVRVFLFWFASIHQLWSQKVPRTTRTLSAPNESLSISVLSLSSPCHALPNVLCSIFSAYVWNPVQAISDPHMFLACSCCCCFFRFSCNEMCLLPHTTPCDASLPPPCFCLQWSTSLGLGWSSSQSCPYSTRQRKLAACCNASSSVCWTVLALICAMTPPSNIAPSFAFSSAFSLPSAMNFLEERHLLYFLFRSGAP